jgi:hypothetical protein
VDCPSKGRVVHRARPLHETKTPVDKPTVIRPTPTPKEGYLSPGPLPYSSFHNMLHYLGFDTERLLVPHGPPLLCLGHQGRTSCASTILVNEECLRVSVETSCRKTMIYVMSSEKRPYNVSQSYNRTKCLEKANKSKQYLSKPQ